MSSPTDNPGSAKRLPRADNHGTIDVYYDGPTDTTVRPCPPELKALAAKQRELIRRWGHLHGIKPAEGQAPPPDAEAQEPAPNADG